MNDARGPADPTDERGHQGEGDARCRPRRARPWRPRRPIRSSLRASPQSPNGAVQIVARASILRHQRDRAVASAAAAPARLAASAVADGRGEDHRRPRRRPVPPSTADAEADEGDPGEADDDADPLRASRHAVEEQRAEQPGEERRRAVEQAGDRRVDVLLGQREQRERDADPDHRHGDEPRRQSARSMRRTGGREDGRARAAPSPTRGPA